MDGVAAITRSEVFPGRDVDVFPAVVAYEDTVTRDRALSICDRLVKKFWADVEFDFSWWRFDFLRNADIAGEAARASARSELVIVSAHAGRELSPAVRKWIETWSQSRKRRHGVLVAMIGTAEDGLRGLTPIHVYLREVAQRAGMDYLPQVLDVPLGKLEGSIEAISKHAEKVTVLLDNILRQPSIPLRWGINE